MAVAGSCCESEAWAELTHGPFIGHVSHTEAKIWARADAEEEYQLRFYPNGGREQEMAREGKKGGAGGSDMSVKAVARAENDFCFRWELTDLDPGREYGYRVYDPEGNLLTDGQGLAFSTPASEPGPGGIRKLRQTVLMFGSCANDKLMPKQAIWDVVGRRPSPDGLVLLGDTPYIDTTDLETQRRRYREFFGMAELKTALCRTPLYATWDDHDFGRNDTTGNLAGKENSRQAFIEYHALGSYGDGENGIYTKFRRGPMDVYLLDTRWFAETEPSPVDSDKPTLLGKAQWEWLLEGLEASSADVKILASGMIWNGSVRPNKTDHWAHYAHERDALFRFIGEKKIGGVVLVGGDIHRSRVVRHATAALAGYDIHEFISSPMATRPMESANQPHPGLIEDIGKSEVLLELTANRKADSTSLTARFLGPNDPETTVYYSFSLEPSEMKSSK